MLRSAKPIVLAVLLAIASPGPALAAPDDMVFSAFANGRTTEVDDVGDGFWVTFTFTGEEFTLGPITGSAEFFLANDGTVSGGLMVLSVEGVGELILDMAGAVSSLGGINVTMDILGGSGQFENASGQLRLTGEWRLLQFQLRFFGTIC
jgi:hypothetical protein